MRLISSNALGAASAVLTLAVALGGCAKDIDTQPAPGAYTQALFDPTAPSPVVPIPTDLAKDAATGLLALPVANKVKNPAQHEFDTYLNSLDGYPTAVSVSACFSADLKADTIATGLKVLALPKADGEQPTVVDDVSVSGTPEQTISCPVMTSVRCDPAGGENTGCMPGQGCIPASVGAYCANPGFKVTFTRAQEWERGRTYAFYLTNAVHDSNDQPVGRAISFELAAAPNPLCEWSETENKCVYNYSALLATQVKAAVKEGTKDFGWSHAEIEQYTHDTILENGTSFEKLRVATDALLKAGAAAGLERNDVVLTWAFSTVGLTEASFDPTAGVIPGPGNDLLLDPSTGKVNIPAQPGETDGEKALRMGLNTLDGFSTTGTYYTIFSDQLDPNTVTLGEDLFVVNVDNPADTVAAKFEWSENANAVTMTPLKPLAESTRYAVVLRSRANASPTTPQEAVAAAGGLADTQGRRVVASVAFALARSSAPLVDDDGKSTVSVLDDASAALFEPVRAGYAALFDSLKANMGIERHEVALLWTFKTQSITTAMTQLRALPYSALAVADSNQPQLTGGLTTNVASAWPSALARDGVGAIGKVLITGFNALDPATGAFRADPTQGAPYKYPAYLTLPTCAATGACTGALPVAIFQHGIGTMKEMFFSLANTLNKAGYAVIAFDAIFHGDRTTCADSTVCNAADDATKGLIKGECVVAALDSYKRCCAVGDNTACGRAYFVPDADGAPTGNGALFTNTSNPFAIRDNIRQHVMDSVALYRTLALGHATDGVTINGGAVTMPALDGTDVNLVSQSVGSIFNVIALAVDSTPKRAALAVPGAPMTQIYALAQRPDFKAFTDALLDGYGFCVDDGGTKVCPRDSAGALYLFHVFQWILDPADAANFAKYVKTESLKDEVASAAAGSDQPVSKKEVLQLVAGADTLILTPLQQQLADWMGNDVTNSTYADATHNFARDEPASSTITAAAHAQIVDFLDTGDICTPDTTAGTCN